MASFATSGSRGFLYMLTFFFSITIFILASCSSLAEAATKLSISTATLTCKMIQATTIEKLQKNNDAFTSIVPSGLTMGKESGHGSPVTIRKQVMKALLKRPNSSGPRLLKSDTPRIETANRKPQAVSYRAR